MGWERWSLCCTQHLTDKQASYERERESLVQVPFSLGPYPRVSELGMRYLTMGNIPPSDWAWSYHWQHIWQQANRPITAVIWKHLRPILAGAAPKFIWRRKTLRLVRTACHRWWNNEFWIIPMNSWGDVRTSVFKLGLKRTSVMQQDNDPNPTSCSTKEGLSTSKGKALERPSQRPELGLLCTSSRRWSEWVKRKLHSSY